jgi:hypothetical protein
MSELSEVVQPIIEYIHSIGGIALRINSGGIPVKGPNGKKYYFRGAPSGTSDIIAGIPFNGKLIFAAIECKLPGKKKSPRQAIFLETVRRSGGISITAYCKMDVILFLEKEGLVMT